MRYSAADHYERRITCEPATFLDAIKTEWIGHVSNPSCATPHASTGLQAACVDYIMCMERTENGIRRSSMCRNENDSDDNDDDDDSVGRCSEK